MFTNSFDIVASFGRFCANNLTKVDVSSLLTYDGMFWGRWGDNLLKFKDCVIMELKENHAPLMLDVHCVAHRINLVV